jgi:hypothetical protein
MMITMKKFASRSWWIVLCILFISIGYINSQCTATSCGAGYFCSSNQCVSTTPPDTSKPDIDTSSTAGIIGGVIAFVGGTCLFYWLKKKLCERPATI